MIHTTWRYQVVAKVEATDAAGKKKSIPFAQTYWFNKPQNIQALRRNCQGWIRTWAEQQGLKANSITNIRVESLPDLRLR